MSNFLMGVVRRGAGLAMPVTVRPARGPEQVPAAVPAFAEPQLGSESGGSVFSERSAIPSTSESVDQSAVRLEPRHETAFSTQDATPPRAVETEIRGLVQPRIEISRPEIAEKTEVREASDPSVAVQPDGLERDSAEATVSISPVKETMPPIEELRALQMQPVIPRAKETSKPVEQKLSPKQERQAVPPAQVQAESSRASNAGSATEAAASEKKTINVKIGRVEIRSAQPAPAVQRPRANSSSGFDDARLSRLYLDRNMR